MLGSLAAVLALWFSSPSHAAMAALSCDSPYAQKESECEALKSWAPANFTNVNPAREQDFEQFTLIYHSMCGYSSTDFVTQKPWRTLLLQDPTRIAANRRISASVISESHLEVWATGVAFVLAVEPENIAGTAYGDAFSPDLNRMEPEAAEALLQQHARSSSWEIRSPAEIIRRSGSGFNEIVLKGKGYKTDNPVRVAAVVLRCSDAKKLTRINRLSDGEFRKKLDDVRCALDGDQKEALLKLRNELPFYCLETKGAYFK